ncbi:MAG: DNA polymerase III subunit epsilon [Burkholderiaceae bacterium]|jgi:DNA polymerase-3 subunit epsilon|nr:DNA polymerase III subunit epsilon [Betaproteobacteria bacterium]
MRLVVLDTETTGLKVEDGHRIIEIGCIELIDRRASGRRLHLYVNPEREVDEGAAQVHGFTWEMLQDKPRFSQIADEFLGFVDGAHLIIHNAPFDLGFLNAELDRLGQPSLASVVAQVTDSLKMARELHPGQRNSLDALCTRYGIANDHRVLHGALLDAELLSEVYLAMTRGQETLDMMPVEDRAATQAALAAMDLSQLIVVEPTPEEWAAHERVLDEIDKACPDGALWRRLEREAQA